MEKWKGYLYLLGGFSLAGTSVIAARLLTPSLGTFTITAASLGIALVGMLPLVWRRLGPSLAHLSRRQALALVFQAVCGIFLFRMFLIQGLLRTSAGEAGILTGATPAFTALLAAVALREPLRPRRALGIASTVAGILCLQGLFSPGSGLSGQHAWGNGLVLCAALCESSFNVISRYSSLNSASDPGQSLSPDVQTWMVAALAFCLCLPPAWLDEAPLPALVALGTGEWLALVWYGLFVTALAFILFYAGIRRCPASTAAVFSGMMPFTALVLSIWVLGESAGLPQWSGGGLVVLGMLLTGE
jgi:drug/metabolite transporter (DMT)-like permease